MVGSPPAKAIDVASSPTSATLFATAAIHGSPLQESTEDTSHICASQLDASVHQQSPKATNPAGSRKRVFTFQKRWLHSLPIIERSLPESDVDHNQALKDACTATGASSSAASDSDTLKNVIVCMLCDEPAVKREMAKVWNRLNCRRGRIENHLMSKHPEFMRLLKHKREAEGDLAVQIFLQNLRDGRCNARTEINTGLYSQLTIGAGAEAVAVGSSSAVAENMELQKRTFGDYTGTAREDLDHRKRFKLTSFPATGMDTVAMASPSPYSAGSMAMLRTNGAASAEASGVDGLASPVLYQDAMMSAQWQTVLYNKLVVVTGGGNSVITSVATHLWLLGANVLLTFANLSALDEFNAKHIGRIPDPSDSEDSPRGVMLPMLGSFRSHADISEWCSSIATKYQRVDFLINYAGPEVLESLLLEDAEEAASKNEFALSSATLIEALSESMSSTCFPSPVAGDDSWLLPSCGTIVNVASAQDDAVIDPLVKALAVKLHPRNIQVNCVLLPLRQAVDAADVEATEDIAALTQSILFLFSPSSRLLSGSVLRLQQDKTLSHVSSSTAAATVQTCGTDATDDTVDAMDSHSI
uniref:Uncharacterized protein n=1 Tax=Peronospora matthiolae TaxID=2874970 RepID=A0AAV1URJ5_9STRA